MDPRFEKARVGRAWLERVIEFAIGVKNLHAHVVRCGRGTLAATGYLVLAIADSNGEIGGRRSRAVRRAGADLSRIIHDLNRVVLRDAGGTGAAGEAVDDLAGGIRRPRRPVRAGTRGRGSTAVHDLLA